MELAKEIALYIDDRQTLDCPMTAREIESIVAERLIPIRDALMMMWNNPEEMAATDIMTQYYAALEMLEEEEPKVTCALMSDEVKVGNAYGVYINFDGNTTDLMSWADTAKVEHFAEICVKINGDEKEFTLTEFMELLGFET